MELTPSPYHEVMVLSLDNEPVYKDVTSKFAHTVLVEKTPQTAPIYTSDDFVFFDIIRDILLSEDIAVFFDGRIVQEPNFKLKDFLEELEQNLSPAPILCDDGSTIDDPEEFIHDVRCFLLSLINIAVKHARGGGSPKRFVDVYLEEDMCHENSTNLCFCFRKIANKNAK